MLALRVLEHEMARRPARAAADRAGILQRLQKAMRDEWIEQGRVGVGAGIPRLGRNVGDARGDLDAGLWLFRHARRGWSDRGASTIGAGRG